MNSVHDTIFGVPLLLEESAKVDEGDIDWVIVTKLDEKTEETVRKVCQAALKCIGEERALGEVILRGTLQELKEIVKQNSDEIETIEMDKEAHAIPDFPEDELDEDTDEEIDALLLEAGKVESWGLDRIDARHGLDNSYKPAAGSGQGVHVYVTDTGIRVAHSDFGGRAIATLEVLGNGVRECQGNTNCAQDKQAHGTHCAGTVGGTKFGVAKEATLHAVKILDDQGSGQFAWWTQALDWIVRKGARPAIVSASMGGGGNSHYVKQAVDRTVQSGVVVVVAAGNENANACNYQPAFVPSAINVGATQNNDRRARFSNYGTCLDIFAPGVNIHSP